MYKLFIYAARGDTDAVHVQKVIGCESGDLVYVLWLEI